MNLSLFLALDVREPRRKVALVLPREWARLSGKELCFEIVKSG